MRFNNRAKESNSSGKLDDSENLFQQQLKASVLIGSGKSQAGSISRSWQFECRQQYTPEVDMSVKIDNLHVMHLN